MNILTIDTSTERLDISIATDTGAIHEHSIQSGFTHTQRLMPTIEQLLKEADVTPKMLDLIVCAKGPGSFTGLRIGMATAKGLRVATNAMLVSIPTLDAYAFAFTWFPGTVIPVIDARRNRVYCAVYKNGKRIGGYSDISAEELSGLVDGDAKCLVVGISDSLIASVAGIIPDAIYTSILLTGPAFATLGKLRLANDGPDGADVGPMYLRASDAEEKLKA
jgi:tRNA threonylcarbamoyladenosine biosynthesis protein TsaB